MKRRLGGEKWTVRDKLVGTHSCHQCPGHIAHGLVIGERRAEILFDHYQKRPRIAYRVYWRMHPEELRLVQEIYKKKKSSK